MASVRAWREGWQVRWYDPGGNQRTKYFKRKSEATQFSNAVEVESSGAPMSTLTLASLSSKTGPPSGCSPRSICELHREPATRATSATT